MSDGTPVENRVQRGLADNTQVAPYPEELAHIIAGLKLTTKPNWIFSLELADRGQGCSGLTFNVIIDEPDAYHEDVQHRRVRHLMPVPPAAFGEQAWRRWVFDQIMLVQLHETMEGFEVDGAHPFAPNHGPGRDPYVVFEYATDEDRRTQYTGEVKPADG